MPSHLPPPPFPKFERKPRWPSAPPICHEANLPAFKTQAEMTAFRVKNAIESHKIIRQWICDSCGCIHYIGDNSRR